MTLIDINARKNATNGVAFFLSQLLPSLYFFVSVPLLMPTDRQMFFVQFFRVNKNRGANFLAFCRASFLRPTKTALQKISFLYRSPIPYHLF